MRCCFTVSKTCFMFDLLYLLDVSMCTLLWKVILQRLSTQLRSFQFGETGTPCVLMTAPEEGVCLSSFLLFSIKWTIYDPYQTTDVTFNRKSQWGLSRRRFLGPNSGKRPCFCPFSSHWGWLGSTARAARWTTLQPKGWRRKATDRTVQICSYSSCCWHSPF